MKLHIPKTKKSNSISQLPEFIPIQSEPSEQKKLPSLSQEFYLKENLNKTKSNSHTRNNSEESKIVKYKNLVNSEFLFENDISNIKKNYSKDSQFSLKSSVLKDPLKSYVPKSLLKKPLKKEEILMSLNQRSTLVLSHRSYQYKPEISLINTNIKEKSENANILIQNSIINTTSPQNKPFENPLLNTEIKEKCENANILIQNSINLKSRKNISNVSFLNEINNKIKKFDENETFLMPEQLFLTENGEEKNNVYSKIFDKEHGGLIYETDLTVLKKKMEEDELFSKLVDLNSIQNEVKNNSELHEKTNKFNKILTKEKIRQNFELKAIPSNRKQIEGLQNWIVYMLNKLQNVEEKKGSTSKELLYNMQIIYTSAFKEIVRQVGASCKERALLLNKIWNAYIGLAEKAILEAQKDVLNIQKENENEIKRIHEMYDIKLKNHEKNFKLLEKEFELQKQKLKNEKKEKKDLNKIAENLEKENCEMDKELDEFYIEYEKINKENFDLKVILDNLKVYSKTAVAAEEKTVLENRDLYGNNKNSVVAHLLQHKLTELATTTPRKSLLKTPRNLTLKTPRTSQFLVPQKVDSFEEYVEIAQQQKKEYEESLIKEQINIFLNSYRLALEQNDPQALHKILKKKPEILFSQEVKPLHYCSINDKEKVLECVLKFIYQKEKEKYLKLVNEKNAVGKTPIQLAFNWESKKCLEVMQEAGGFVIETVSEDINQFQDVNEKWLENFSDDYYEQKK